MPINIEALLVEIDEIHSDHDIDQEVTDKVNAAVKAAVAAEVPVDVATAIAPLQKQVDDQGTALQAIVDKLTAPGVTAQDITAAAGIAQNALTPPAAETGTGDAGAQG